MKEADPTQERTKIVLTKADLIQPGDEKRWLDILEDRGKSRSRTPPPHRRNSERVWGGDS